MFNQSYNLSKILIIVIVSLIFFSCDEDYVSSLSNTQDTRAYLEPTTDLNDFYLGENLNLELILKVEDSPYVSNLAFSVLCNPLYFNPDTILISSQENNLFYNTSPQSIIENFTAFTDSTFEINLGFIDDQRNNIKSLLEKNNFVRVFEKISRMDDWYINKNNSVLKKLKLNNR